MAQNVYLLDKNMKRVVRVKSGVRARVACTNDPGLPDSPDRSDLAVSASG